MLPSVDSKQNKKAPGCEKTGCFFVEMKAADGPQRSAVNGLDTEEQGYNGDKWDS